MGQYWKLLAEYDAETTTYSACAGAFGTSPYTPTEDATLIGLRTTLSAEAATSLTENVQFKLTCSTFKPNSIECGGIGGGVHTALQPVPPPVDWPVNQPVSAGVPIIIEGRNITADTPVTVEMYLWGCFES